ncbi:phosphoglycerate mutase [uncultured Xylophilus sp.]|uniref:phosphoglycerate mutase n=1 Tax=uncultured Xylophilus sp. TaxID=296832 RepID=UPI0025EC7B2F|nr:phosphoglycerate mutase [uncultured Xylophilus sp.]
MHLLISYAAALAPGCEAAARTLALPRLERLLAGMAPAGGDAGDEFTLSPPHERALARALGLPVEDGRLPWAARSAAADGQDVAADAWAWVTPCHWQVAPDHIGMLDPAVLQLSEDESRRLLALVAPYFAEDGMALEFVAPTRWRARGAPLRGLATASLDRVTGRSIDLWMPDGPEARPLRRLQGEMQMLLYTDPSTDARNARGQLAVNAFWFSGTGDWPAGAAADAPGLEMPDDLRAAALRDDWVAWADGWRRIDADACARLAAAVDRGEPATLTLCGERSSLTFRHVPRSGLGRWVHRFKSISGRLRFPHLREQL